MTPIGPSRDAKRLRLGVAEEDVHELAADEVACEGGEPVEPIIGVGVGVEELRRAQERRRDLGLLPLARVQSGVLDRERGLGRDAGRELALERR